jgi:toxin ParE1/3/4
MPSWMLSADALRDLREIRRYTEREWGNQQALKYRVQLRACAERLANQPTSGKNMSELKTGLRSLRCQHHYIFCMFAAETPPLVVAIFHERMDLITRIAARLK